MDQKNQQKAAPDQKPAVGGQQTGHPPIQNPGHQRPASDTAPRAPGKPASDHETPSRDSHTGDAPPKT
jgi:hypothetical protein